MNKILALGLLLLVGNVQAVGITATTLLKDQSYIVGSTFKDEGGRMHSITQLTDIGCRMSSCCPSALSYVEKSVRSVGPGLFTRQTFKAYIRAEITSHKITQCADPAHVNKDLGRIEYILAQPILLTKEFTPLTKALVVIACCTAAAGVWKHREFLMKKAQELNKKIFDFVK